MKTKTFEYNVNDIKMLKRDLVLRIVLCIMLGAIMIWQGVILALELINTTIDQFKIISTSFVFATAIIYLILGIFYTAKNRRIIRVIKSTGKCTSSVTFIFNVKKHGFVRIYHILTIALTLLSIFVLIAAITYAILSVSILKELSYFYPVLITLCVVGLYSCLHISTEIKSLEKVGRINQM